MSSMTRALAMIMALAALAAGCGKKKHHHDEPAVVEPLLTATAMSPTSILLKWKRPGGIFSSNIKTYIDCNGSHIVTTSMTWYLHEGLSPNSTYQYSVFSTATVMFFFIIQQSSFGPYTATCTTPAANPLAQPLQSVKASWGSPVKIEANDTENANGCRIAADPEGNVTAIWRQHDGARYNLWANRFEPDSGWGTPVLLESGDSDALMHEIVVDSGGTVTVAWLQGAYQGGQLWFTRWVPGSGWSEAVSVEGTCSFTDPPRLAVDSDGVVTALWIQEGNVVSSRFESASGW